MYLIELDLTFESAEDFAPSRTTQITIGRLQKYIDDKRSTNKCKLINISIGQVIEFWGSIGQWNSSNCPPTLLQFLKHVISLCHVTSHLSTKLIFKTLFKEDHHIPNRVNTAITGLCASEVNYASKKSEHKPLSNALHLSPSNATTHVSNKHLLTDSRDFHDTKVDFRFANRFKITLHHGDFQGALYSSENVPLVKSSSSLRRWWKIPQSTAAYGKCVFYLLCSFLPFFMFYTRTMCITIMWARKELKRGHIYLQYCNTFVHICAGLRHRTTKFRRRSVQTCT